MQQGWAEARQKPSRHHVDGIDSEQPWRHDGQRPRPILSDDPVDFLAQLQHLEDGIVRRLGCSENHDAFQLGLLDVLELPADLGGVDDGVVEAVAREVGHVGLRRDAARDDELPALERFIASGPLDADPPARLQLVDFGGSRVQPDSTDEIEVSGEVVEVAVDGLAGDVAVGSQAFFLHGVERVFEEAVTDLGEEVGVDAFLAPDAADGFAIVEEEDVASRGELQVGGCGDEAVPACGA